MPICAPCLVILYLEAFVNVLSGALTLAIFGRVLLAWVPSRLPLGLNAFIFGVTEPILGPIRRVLPSAGGMDFSPFVALIAIQLATSLVLRVLPPVV
ncbi:MAG TPA: YggT family protein [Candidatus Limnocylindria bacterium]|jgi:YggT family protein